MKFGNGQWRHWFEASSQTDPVGQTWLTVVVVVDPVPVDPDPVEADPVSDHQTGARYLQSQLTHWLFFHSYPDGHLLHCPLIKVHPDGQTQCSPFQMNGDGQRQV